MEDLNCQLCGEEYNSRRNLPRLFPNCGHTFCSACIGKLIEEADGVLCCPEDGVECQFFNKSIGIGCFPLNFVLQKILDLKPSERTSRNFERPMPRSNEDAGLHYCNDHSKVSDLVCISDKKVICTDCALFGAHKTHAFMKMDDFKRELKSKLMSLESQAEAVRLKPLIADSERELANLRGKVESHKNRMRRDIRSYVDAVVDKLQSHAANLERMILSKFTKFDCGLTVIDSTAADIRERYQLVERTVSKVRSQVKCREYDYVFLMNSLYAEKDSTFSKLKEIGNELAELEATTRDIIDDELNKYAMADDVESAVNAVVECIEMQYCDKICSGVADELPSDLGDEIEENESNLVTPQKPSPVLKELKIRSRDVGKSKPKSRPQLSSNDPSADSRTQKSREKELEIYKLKNRTTSLLDIQIDEMDIHLANYRPTYDKTPPDDSMYNPTGFNATSKLQPLKRTSSFIKAEIQRNQMLSSAHTLNFGFGINNKPESHGHDRCITQTTNTMSKSGNRTETRNSLSNKHTHSDSLMQTNEKKPEQQQNPRYNSWTDSASIYDAYQLPRTTLQRPTLVNKLSITAVNQINLETDTEVNLSRSNITDASLSPLLNELIKNKRMKALNLSHNNITEVGFDELLRKLGAHPTLERVYLLSNPLSEDIFVKLEQRAKKLKKLNYFNLQNCSQFKSASKIRKYIASIGKYGIRLDV